MDLGMAPQGSAKGKVRMAVAKIEDVVAAMGRGEMVILVDDEHRENEGDLCMAAELVTPEAINFMATHGRGLICLAMTEERLTALQIPRMVEENTSRMRTAFTVSIEARSGVTTGISAADRARTVQVAVADGSTPGDLARPGHIFPLAARRGGVLERTGQTEGSVDLARLAGCKAAAVICEIMNDDGTMARMADLERFAARHGLLIATIADLIAYRLRREYLVERVLSVPCHLESLGDFQGHVFRSQVDGSEHFALSRGDLSGDAPVLVRVHAGSRWNDMFALVGMNDDGDLAFSLRRIADEGRGVLLYVQRPADSLQTVLSGMLGLESAAPESWGEEQLNAPPLEMRLFGIGAQCLRALGVERMRVLTHTPTKIVGLEAFGLQVVEYVTLESPSERADARKVGHADNH